MFNDKDVILAFIYVIISSMLLGASLVLVLPEIWEWIKPIIHEFTK